MAGSRGIELTAYISQNGLHGEVTFQRHSSNTGSLLVKVSLQPVDEFSKWSWSIREYPVHYNNLEDRCREEKLGLQYVLLKYLSLYFNNSEFFVINLKINIYYLIHKIWVY